VIPPRAARIGAAFSCQIVAEIPADSHDVPADRIVTEQEIIIPDRRASGGMYAAAFPMAGGRGRRFALDRAPGSGQDAAHFDERFTVFYGSIIFSFA